MKKAIIEAKKHLQRAKELSKSLPSHFKGLSHEEAIKKMRKVREELWEEKFALRS